MQKNQKDGYVMSKRVVEVAQQISKEVVCGALASQTWHIGGAEGARAKQPGQWFLGDKASVWVGSAKSWFRHPTRNECMGWFTQIKI